MCSTFNCSQSHAHTSDLWKFFHVLPTATCSFLLLVVMSLLLVASFFLVVRPGATSSVLAPFAAMPGAPNSVRVTGSLLLSGHILIAQCANTKALPNPAPSPAAGAGPSAPAGARVMWKNEVKESKAQNVKKISQTGPATSQAEPKSPQTLTKLGTKWAFFMNLSGSRDEIQKCTTQPVSCLNFTAFANLSHQHTC